MVPFLRPVELANDTATTNDVVSHMVKWVEAEHDVVELVALLQPTSPLRDADNIKDAMKLYEEKNASSVISVCELDHPIQYCNRLPNDFSMKDFVTVSANKRTQDLEPYYRLNGAIYIFERKFVGFLSEIYSDNSFSYIMNKESSVDIDDEYDFLFASFLLLRHRQGGK